MKHRKSIYSHLHTRNDELKNLGYDYSKTILKNTMSDKMFDTNQTMYTYLEYLNNIVYDIIESVKIIKTYACISCDKNEKRIN